MESLWLWVQWDCKTVDRLNSGAREQGGGMFSLKNKIIKRSTKSWMNAVKEIITAVQNIDRWIYTQYELACAHGRMQICFIFI